MTAKEILLALKELGTEQNVKVYSKHGVGPNMYGVSFGNLKALAKKIKKDHNAAVELWQSGNHDARILATMIADPQKMEPQLLDLWVDDLDNYVITDAFASFVAKTPHAKEKGEEWRRSQAEWVSSAGWTILATLAMKSDELEDDYFAKHLSTIAATIHTQPNRTRYSMNNALIAIGIRSKALEELAIVAAEAIGKVEVDHGETGCKTPDAVPYIRKARDRKAAKKK